MAPDETELEVVSVPAGISLAGMRRMGRYFNDRYTGVINAKKVMFVDAGTSFKPIAVSPEDAEVLESRHFAVVELCRLFNVPPPIIQAYENNTVANAVTESTWFVVNSLGPTAYRRPWRRG